MILVAKKKTFEKLMQTLFVSPRMNLIYMLLYQAASLHSNQSVCDPIIEQIPGGKNTSQSVIK